LKFVAVENVDEVLAVALEKNGADQAGESASSKGLTKEKEKSPKTESATKTE
jgi:hypothetical protein